MTAFNVIILAGGEKGPLYEPTGYEEKALIPIHGKPMLSRVIECFHASGMVDNIVVVGSANLDALEAMSLVRKRIFTGVNLVQNLLHAVAYVRHRLCSGDPDHNGYIISFCDAVFLTPEVVRHTLEEIARDPADVVLSYVEKSSFERAGLPAQRTYLPIAGMELTGGTIYYVRRFTPIVSIMPKLAQLRKHRKHPAKFLEAIGCRPNMDLAAVERTLSEQLDLRLRIHISPHAGLGMDVDKPSDLELAERLLGAEGAQGPVD